jgi:hypothetical protein
LKRQVFKFLSITGVLVTVGAIIGLGLGFAGVIDFGNFAFGLSAGIRMLGSIAIAGCLLSAIGFFGLENGA